MSNALGISPAVMINRIVTRNATPLAAHLGKVAELRMKLENARAAEQAQAELLNPAEPAAKPAMVTGADVDRLV
ncbi:hypothetical protein [Devosia sp. FKR38]|uniref:hypothetical protein n=1 Tax=Devosia sp. FKR38 TaxID=2562312 RepID=UPI0010C02882|nr:hypothetical protein [Devosia sp. FKR38]